MAALTTKNIADLANVKPNTRGYEALRLAYLIKDIAFGQASGLGAGYEAMRNAYFTVGAAAQLLSWAVDTGRVNHADALNFREMGAWKTIKVIERIAAVDLSGTFEADKVAVVCEAIRTVKKG